MYYFIEVPNNLCLIGTKWVYFTIGLLLYKNLFIIL